MKLSEDGKVLIVNKSESYDISRIIVDLENAKHDLNARKSDIDRFENKVSELEKLVKKARDLGFLTDAEKDALEQKRFEEERKERDRLAAIEREKVEQK